MIIKSIKLKVLEYFLLNPTKKLRVREIERKAKVPLPSAIRYAKELEKEGILKATEISTIRFYEADRSSKKFLMEKKLYNIRSIIESGIVEYVAFECSNPVLVVFGSYSRGEDTETSGVDLYIESHKKPDISEFERKLHRKIQLFAYDDINHVKNKELANSIINGIALNGFLEVLK